MKVQIQIIEPDALTDNARVRRLDPELSSMSERVELNSSDTKTHLGMEDAWQRLEVEQNHQKDESSDMLANHGLVRSHVLKVERDEVGGKLQHGRRHAQKNLVHR